jgi:hypothetical protein
VRNRLLVRLFLRRFLEHDLVSSNADRREVLSVAGGTLGAISLFVSTLIALQYQFTAFLPPGITSLRSLDERFLFVSASMLVMALLAVALWDALTLEPRDAAVLGVLPVPRAAIVRARFAAVGVVALATDVGWNLAPTVWRAASLPITLHVGFTGGVALTLAQGFVMTTAGAFAFLAIFGLRETLTAILGHERFRLVSSGIQAALLVTLASALLLLPGSYVGIARTWIAPGGIAAKALPPLWFVGLHESLVGSVLDNLPRTTPERFLIVQERDATALYRSLWSQYHQLGRVALIALVVVVLVTVAASAWNSRRLPAPAGRRQRHDVTLTRAWRWGVARVFAPASLQQAGFWFTLQTLPRQATHRVVLASTLAVGLSVVTFAVRGHAVAIRTGIASVPLSILAAQSLLLVSVLTGVRLAVLRPAELRASTTFSLAWSGELGPYLSGVKRAGWIAVALPILAILAPWHLAVLGARIAALHFFVGAVFSVLTTELLFLRYRRLPLASGYVPVSDLKSRGVACIVGGVCVCYVLAAIERLALESLTGVFVFVGVLLASAAGLAILDQASRESPVMFELDEELPLPTQRLDLAG